MSSDFVVFGATGSTGGLVADRLIRRGASVVLAGRDPGRLAEAAERLAPGNPSVTTMTVDLDDHAAVSAMARAARVLVNAVGPFARLAPAVVTACLAAGTAYVDIANERAAVRALLDLDGEARERGVCLVTGAGFGLAATEALVLTLLAQGVRPSRVVVAAASGSLRESEGVRNTVAEAVADGATTYRGGELVRAPFGSGATDLSFGGAARQVVPAPVGDLEAARRISGAADVTAYLAMGGGGSPEQRSHSYAEFVDEAGRAHTAELSTVQGFVFSASIATETALRLLAGERPGAWTPCELLGVDLVTAVAGTTIEVSAPALLPGR
ncbi:SDR family NAD(P)-dependent oxidoreductase [Kitasatospora sp. NBC_01266]|uniref:SDR family NAD(P)-dependent oxidoreductase n=1 Tax=Kitasatospora sp. NBC_01266 TaxID=2903572 RepID=UPI002E2F7267|nr:SDR family NAD(P)-dependent oxidoreductase [Kitasatospora sp. NBC_01266]